MKNLTARFSDSKRAKLRNYGPYFAAAAAIACQQLTVAGFADCGLRLVDSWPGQIETDF